MFEWIDSLDTALRLMNNFDTFFLLEPFYILVGFVRTENKRKNSHSRCKNFYTFLNKQF